MESFNFGAFDTNLGARIAAIPQEAQKQQTANMLQAMQMQGVMNQNELAQSQMRTAKRAEEGQTLLGKAYGGLDFSGAGEGGVPGQSPFAAMKSQVIKSLTASNRPDLIPSELAKLTEMEHKANVNEELKGKLAEQARKAVDAELTSFTKNAFKVTGVPSLTTHLRAFYDNPLLGKIAARFKPYEQALEDDIKQISTPEGLRQWQAENANLTGKELTDLLLKVTTNTENLGDVSRTTQRGGMGQTIGVPVDTPMGMTPGQVQTAKDALAGREQSARQFNLGGYTYDLQAGVRYDRNGVASPLMQQAPPAGGAAVGGGVPTGRNAAGLVPVGAKPEKPTESYYSEAKGILNTNDAINNLKQVISNFTPTDMVNPARRAEIDQAHKTAVLLSKEMFKLGVLNGGDQKILEQVIPDPIAFSKGLVSIETIRKNMSSASNIVNNMNKNLSRVHKQPLLSLDAETLNAPSPSAPPIQSFRRP